MTDAPPVETASSVSERWSERTEVPPATPATPDLVCWIWAAIPARDGMINLTRAAGRFGVSRTTLRRWIHQGVPAPRAGQFVSRAFQLAILRGHGQILWPGLDASSRRRSEVNRSRAEAAARLITDAPEQIPPAWRQNNTLEPHQVLLVHWPKAYAHTVAITRTARHRSKIINGGGMIIDEQVAPHLYAAEMIKYRTLAAYAELRCITPRTLVPVGHTEAWRQLRGQNEPHFDTTKTEDDRHGVGRGSNGPK